MRRKQLGTRGYGQQPGDHGTERRRRQKRRGRGAATEPVFFGGMMLAALPSVSSRAVSLPGKINACILARDGSGLGLNAATNGQIHAEPCDIYVNSKSACGLTISGNGGYYLTNVVVGMPTLNGCVSGSPSEGSTGTQTYSAPAVPDPYESRPIPLAVGCITAGPFTGATKASIGPRTYCGGIVVDNTAQLTFRTGVYVFDHGSLDIRSGGAVVKLDPADGGAGVSLVFTSSDGLNYASLNVTTAVNVQLTPLKSGPTAGILFWSDGAGATPITITGGFTVTGAFSVPGATATFTGSSTMTFPCGQLVADRIVYSGNATATFTKNNCDQYNMAGYSNTAATGAYTLRE